MNLSVSKLIYAIGALPLFCRGEMIFHPYCPEDFDRHWSYEIGVAAITSKSIEEILLGRINRPKGVQRQLKLSSTTIKTGHWRQVDLGAI